MPDDGIPIPRLGPLPYAVVPNIRGPDPLSANDEVRPAAAVRAIVASYMESGGALIPTRERARLRAAPPEAPAPPAQRGLGERIDVYA